MIGTLRGLSMAILFSLASSLGCGVGGGGGTGSATSTARKPGPTSDAPVASASGQPAAVAADSPGTPLKFEMAATRNVKTLRVLLDGKPVKEGHSLDIADGLHEVTIVGESDSDVIKKLRMQLRAGSFGAKPITCKKNDEKSNLECQVPTHVTPPEKLIVVPFPSLDDVDAGPSRDGG